MSTGLLQTIMRYMKRASGTASVHAALAMPAGLGVGEGEGSRQGVEEAC